MEKDKQKIVKKVPPTIQLMSTQHDLFSQFFGERSQCSNTIELWDGVPKYFVAKQRQDKLRDEKGNLPLLKKEFKYRGVDCRVIIQPVVLELNDGTDKAYYPSASEEMLEDVLRKFFSERQLGFHDVTQNESWVKFSLQMIKKELAGKGKARSIAEIKKSLEILSGAVLKLYVNGELIYSSPILSDLTKVTRKGYLEDRSSHWVARLPALVSKSVNELSYRQYNYAKMMEFKNQASRWFIKRISHHYINAGIGSQYEFLLSSIVRDSGLFPHSRISNRIIAFEKMLKELNNAHVLNGFSKEERRGSRNAIEDVHYKLYAHPEFIKEIKAANARKNTASETLQMTMDPVDNLV